MKKLLLVFGVFIIMSSCTGETQINDYIDANKECMTSWSLCIDEWEKANTRTAECIEFVEKLGVISE